MTAIDPVQLRVALQESEEAPRFSFSRKWTVPRLVLQLSSGRMALLNITSLVADDHLACEDLLVVLPVLQHLGIDTRTLLERNWNTLSGTDCSDNKSTHDARNCGSLERLIVDKKENEDAEATDHHKVVPDPSQICAGYDAQRVEIDPFPDPSMIDVPDASEDTLVMTEIKAMLERAKAEGLPDKHLKDLEDLVWQYADCFDMSFSPSPALIEPLRILLQPDAKAIRVKLRNYSEEQRDFMKTLVSHIVASGCIYANSTST